MEVVPDGLKLIVEAALLAAGRPLSLDALLGLFAEHEMPERKTLRAALDQLAEDYAGRGIEVREVASGWRIQVRREFAPAIARLWEEKPGRYSRATMETLALIAYRQPITRGEIEDIRGVSVSTQIVKTLLEREWIHVVGHRDVPGKPALYGTTREFLDYFNLKSLDELPPLAEIRDLEEINRELKLVDPMELAALVAGGAGAEVSPEGERPEEERSVEGAAEQEPPEEATAAAAADRDAGTVEGATEAGGSDEELPRRSGSELPNV
jgi:segregation and condensation protein B